MTSPVDFNELQAGDFSALRLSTKQVTLAAEAARAEYVAEQFGGFGERIAGAFRKVTELFSFAQQTNQAARL